MSFHTTNTQKPEKTVLDSVSALDSVMAKQNNQLASLAPRLFRSSDDKSAQELMYAFKHQYVGRYAGDNKDGLPRFDEFSMMARRTSFFLYDCPMFTASVGCDTAFVTNGDHVFMHAEFFKKLVKWEQDSVVIKNGVRQRTEQNVDFVLTHELGHASAGHHELFMTMPVENATGAGNAGTDTWLNLNYGPMFSINKELKGTWNAELGLIVKGSYGLTDEERVFFKDENGIGCVSDVAMIRHYAKAMAEKKKLQEELKKLQQSGNSQQNSGNDPGKAQQGKGNESGEPQQGSGNEPGDQQPDQGNESSDPQNGEGKGVSGGPESSSKTDPDGKPNAGRGSLEAQIKKAIDAIDSAINNSKDDVHVISTEDLAKALEQSGHGKFKDDLLKLPDSNDAKAHGHLQQRAKADALTDHHQVAQMIKEYEARTGQKYAGGHIHQCMSELIKRRHAVPDSDLNMEDQILNHMIPGGQEMQFSEETPDDYFFVDPSALGQQYRLNRGSDIYINRERCILAILDSSGSMNNSYLSQVAASTQGIIEGDNPVTKVYLLHADTVARTGFVEIDEDNAAQLLENLEVFGRGGTDLQNGICSAIAMAHAEEFYHTVAGILVLTDTFDEPPHTEQMEQIVESITGHSELPPIAYVVPQGIAVENFALRVAGHGTVIVYNERQMDLDLTVSGNISAPRAGL